MDERKRDLSNYRLSQAEDSIKVAKMSYGVLLVGEARKVCQKGTYEKGGDFGNRDRVAAGRSGNSGLCDL